MKRADRPQIRRCHTEAGTGETLLLLHGSASTGAVWRRYVDPLARAGYRVVVPDLIGYGKTGAWPRGARYTLADEMELIRGLLPRDGTGFHVVGHSYGGVVALGLAVADPPGLASLTLVEPVAFFVLRYARETEAYAEVSKIRDAFLAELDQGHVEDALRLFLAYWTGPDSWDSLPERAREEARNSAQKIRLDWEASFNTDPSIDRLRAIRARTLLLHGSKSPLSTRCVIAALSRILPHSTLRAVEGANHLLPLTHGLALTEAILAHLGSGAEAAERTV